MHLVYASDNNYFTYMEASIRGLLEYNKDVTVHILSDGIDVKKLLLLKKIGDIRIYDLKNMEAKLKERVRGLDTGRFRITTLLRLLIGSVIDADRALYLDSDTVVNGSLEELYNTDMGENVLAMAEEPTIYRKAKLNLGLAENDRYFNAGVVLFDLKRWREEHFEEKCFEFYNERKGRLPFNDQDILNYIGKGRIKLIPQKYNFISNYYYFSLESLKKLSKLYSETKESFENAKSDPVIVHFAGDERPWIRGSHNPYRKIFLKFSDDFKEIKGKRLYMELYHLMNLLSLFLPQLRKKISDLYFDKTYGSYL